MSGILNFDSSSCSPGENIWSSQPEPESSDDATPLRLVEDGKFREVIDHADIGAVVRLANGKEKLIAKIAPASDSDRLEAVKLESNATVLVTNVCENTANAVREEFQRKSQMIELLPEESKEFIDLTFEEVGDGDPDKIEGKTTYRVPEASGDLENALRKSDLTIEQRFNMGEDALTGMAYLHDGGFLHGDLKPENFLERSEKKGESEKGESSRGSIGRIVVSDFGKTKQVKNPSRQSLHRGNPRFAPPEGKSSDKGEVYAMGLVLVRIFEEEFLDKDNLLLDVEAKKAIEASPKLRGVERYIVKHPDISGCDSSAGTLKQIASRGKQAAGVGAAKHAQAILLYKDKLIEKEFEVNGPSFAESLDHLLSKMLAENPEKRPLMLDALNEYRGIRKNLERV